MADTVLIYLVIHELIAGSEANNPKLRAAGKVHDFWEDADKAACDLARDFKVQAWVVGFMDPRS